MTARFWLWALLSFSAGVQTNSVHYSKDVLYWGDNYATLGQPFTIHCKISVFDKFMWTKDGVPLADHQTDKAFNYSQVKTETNERILTLKVRGSNLNSGGKYRCNRFDRSFHELKIITDDIEKRNTTNTTFSSKILRIGEALTIHCPIDIPTTQTVQWYKNGHRLSSNVNIEMTPRNLTIPNPGASDAGEYMCNLASQEEEGLVPHYGHLISVQYRAAVQPFPPMIELTQGDNLTLECTANGFPRPKITWFVGNVKVSYHHRAQLRILSGQNSKDVLFINQVLLSDTNLFTCHAENALGSEESSTFLHVKESSIVTNGNKYTRELFMTIGKPLVLQCNTTDDPTWNVRWFKDGEKRIYGEEPRTEIFEENNTLVIRDTTEYDAGEYMCIVSEHKENKIVSATIIVLSRKLVASGEDTDGIVILNLKEPMQLSCSSITGQNDWDVLWYKNEQLLEENEHVTMNSSTNSLIIETPNEGDCGDYMCVVKANKIDILVNATILVRTIPKIKAFPISENVFEGELFSLHCLITSGSPKLKISWYKDEEQIGIYDEHYLILEDEKHEHAKLVIEEIVWEDRAYYKCLVENEYGSDETKILLRVKDKYAALWPFMGICVQMAILYCVITIHGKLQKNESDSRSRTVQRLSVPRRGKVTPSKGAT